MGWRWIFYINFPVGLLAVFLIMIFIQDPPYIRRRQFRIDRWGLLFLTIGLGSLQIVLDKGEREDCQLSFHYCVEPHRGCGTHCLRARRLRIPHPVVNLRVFRHKSFTSGSLTMFAGFFALFGTLVLLPLYVQNLMGYTALWAGLVRPGRMASFLVMPIAGLLMRRGVNPRNLLALGLATITYSLWLMSEFNLEASFYAISYPESCWASGWGSSLCPSPRPPS